MASERRQLVVLGAIVALFFAVVWWQMTRDEEGPQAATAAVAAPAAPSGPGKSVPPMVMRQVPEVGLAELDRNGAEPIDTGRDPFRFGTAREAAPGGFERAMPPGSAPPMRPGTPGGPVEPSGPAPIALKYIGRAKQGATGRLLAVLRDDRGVYYGAEGDVIEGRYRLLRVTDDSVEVAYVDGRGRKTIPLSGGQP